MNCGNASGPLTALTSLTEGFLLPEAPLVPFWPFRPCKPSRPGNPTGPETHHRPVTHKGRPAIDLHWPELAGTTQRVCWWRRTDSSGRNHELSLSRCHHQGWVCDNCYSLTHSLDGHRLPRLLNTFTCLVSKYRCGFMTISRTSLSNQIQSRITETWCRKRLDEERDWTGANLGLLSPRVSLFPVHCGL